MNRSVLILNQNYEPLTTCSVRRGIVLMYLNKAELVETYDGAVVKSVRHQFVVPSVLRLLSYVRRTHRRIPLSRRNVLKRDGHRCQYCGTTEAPLTIDHIVPRKFGGQDTWENLVTACAACNTQKGHRTPEQAGMSLSRKPKEPHYFMSILSASKQPDEKWKPYLFMS
ncbi:MAG: HNH endonuclease [Gemmatimonadetes bacterium]|nr:MAG: HNH endonuclease [Gemmatimonadota bacterium]